LNCKLKYFGPKVSIIFGLSLINQFKVALFNFFILGFFCLTNYFINNLLDYLGRITINELFLPNKKSELGLIGFIYSCSDSVIKNLENNIFKVYQGSFFSFSSEKYNLYLPVTFASERSNLFLNFEGRYRSTKDILNRKASYSDWEVFQLFF
jgi:hypothetical protein